MDCPLFGSFHSFVPSARPRKFSTVFGAFSGSSFTTMSPIDVLKVAYTASAIGLLLGVRERSGDHRRERERSEARSIHRRDASGAPEGGQMETPGPGDA